MAGARELERMPWKENLLQAGIVWAAGGPARLLVDAAGDALEAGIDTPSLRLLAGALSASIDDEARELAPKLFEELGLDLPAWKSPAALIGYTKTLAARFLAEGGSPEQLARDAWDLYLSAESPESLADLAGLADAYDVLEYSGYGDGQTLAAQVREAAERLVAMDESVRHTR